LTKTGTGTLTITNAGNLTSALTLSTAGGAVTLSGTGALPNLGTVTVGQGATFNVDNSGTNLANRTGLATNLTLNNSATAGTSPNPRLLHAAADALRRRQRRHDVHRLRRHRAGHLRPGPRADQVQSDDRIVHRQHQQRRPGVADADLD